MNIENLEKQIESLIAKAAEAETAADALHYSQAACNAANALCATKSARTIGE